MSQTQSSAMYIRELPLETRTKLCRLLDYQDLWKKAADKMQYSSMETDEFESKARSYQQSPTEILLMDWGEKLKTTHQLYLVLHDMHSGPHIPAISCLQRYVSEDFQKLVTQLQIKRNRRDNMSTRYDTTSTIQLEIPEDVKRIEKEYGVNTVSDQAGLDYKKNTESQSKAQLLSQVPPIMSIEYEELRRATNNWDPSNFLDSGGFGEVYKGERNHQMLAIKRLTRKCNDKEMYAELCLNEYRHDNILPLYGYSHGGPESLLVYQLMSGGSLQDRLRCKAARPPLTWQQRHRIAHGVAKGILHLHLMPGGPVIHGDIKPANILLEQYGDHCIAKIGDFGLARKGEMHKNLEVSSIMGTRPYLPEEYVISRIPSPAVDVFSFGVVMLEMATGLPAVYKEVFLTVFIHDEYSQVDDYGELAKSFEDKSIAETRESNLYLCENFIKMGLLSTSKIEIRPPIVAIVEELKRIEPTINNNV